MKYDVGTFRTRARVLECRAVDGGFDWISVGSFWCRRERAGLNRIFSRIGLSAEGWDITLRAAPLTLANALRVGSEHYFICNIGKPAGGYMTVETARVRVARCFGNAERRREEMFFFPGVFTELYIKHEQREPMSVNVIDYALVTPKIVRLRPGSLVEAEGVRYEVLTAHTLDEAKNEYTARKLKEL